MKCNHGECSFATNNVLSLKHHIENLHLKILKYTCNVCEMKSYFKDIILAHGKIYHSADNFKAKRIGCTLCTKDKDHLKHDIRRNRGKSKENSTTIIHKFGCNVCDYKSDRRQNVKSHQNYIHKNVEIRVLLLDCNLCAQGAEHQHNRVVNRKSNVKVEESFHCNSCDSSFVSKVNLEDHTNSFHLNIKRFQCGNCDFQHYSKKYFENHYKINHPLEADRKVLSINAKKAEKKGDTKNIVCFECDYEAFASQRERVKHYQKEHPGAKMFKCKDCGYRSNYLTNLRSHRQSMHENKVLECTKCKYTTTWNQVLLAHMRMVHGVFQKKSKHFTDGKTYLCDGCGLSTLSKVLYDAHKAAPSCDVAPKSVNMNGRISDRRPRNHDKIKKFKCNRCSFSADYAPNVNLHIQTVHEKIRPFKCESEGCKFETITNQNLKLHVQTVHEKIKPFKCNSVDCKFETGTKQNLKLHQQNVHEKIKPFKCSSVHCKFETGTKQNLQVHVKSVHNT